VINLPLDAKLFKPFQHLVIEAEDDEDENLLQHFAESNRFIEDGLERGGGVFVHWWVEGIPRSLCKVLRFLSSRYRELCGLELAAHFKHYGYDLTAIR
jgi:dual specificity phosphatase 12